MEETERALFESGVRRATETADGAALDVALHDLGWRDALAADRAAAVAVLFESLGVTTTSSGALDWLLAAALGVGDGVEGTAVVLPPLRLTDAPGRVDGDRCVVAGLGSAAMDRCDRTLVVATSARGTTAFVVDPALLHRRRVHGLDPALGLVEVKGEFARADAQQCEPPAWAAALALGQLALGHQLIGTGRVMLELARAHALERVQFGRPIASFQAVRHRLAESLVMLDAAAALLDAVWEDPSPEAAAMAKAFAGKSARATARHCQQVLAGIGFTTEHPLHHSVRRAIVLDQLLGAGAVLTRALGADILRDGALPAAFAL
ncbi:MAG: acyl-CoA dehydrogenase family protein [Acidimicrobiales bacterium]